MKSVAIAVGLLPLSLALLLISPGVTLAASEDENLRYGIAGNNQVFTSVDEALAGGTFRLTVKGGQQGTFSAELVDLYADESGTKTALPLNSNPYTADGFVEFESVVGRYIPNGEFQNIDVPFALRNIENVTRPVLGGLKVTLVPDEKSDSGLVLASSIIATFAYYPLGYLNSPESEIKPALEVGSVAFERESGDVFPLNLIPDFPILFNFGPISATSTVRNTGNIFLDVTTQVAVKETNYFGEKPKDPFLESAPRETFLVPNQSLELTEDLVNGTNLSESLKDLPRIGVFEVVSTATGSLGSTLIVSDSESKVLILFPWKYALALLTLITLIILVVIGVRVRRKSA